MTNYLRTREQYFFQSYPAESIRLAERLQKKLEKTSITDPGWWPGHRVHEINMIKLGKLASYQATGRWT